MTALHQSIWLWNPLQGHLKRKKVIWGWFCNSFTLCSSIYIFNMKFRILFPFRQWFCNKLSQSPVNVQDTTFAKDIRKFIRANIYNIHVTSHCLYLLYNLYLFALSNFVCISAVIWNTFLWWHAPNWLQEIEVHKGKERKKKNFKGKMFELVEWLQKLIRGTEGKDLIELWIWSPCGSSCEV